VNQEPAPTGWQGHMMQDECRALFDWLASRPDARRLADEAAEAISSAPKTQALPPAA